VCQIATSTVRKITSLNELPNLHEEYMRTTEYGVTTLVTYSGVEII